ncbi:interactor protein for cytohesin exchange factors 1 isoform X1 [Pleurodeles waltl]|uniref:interactor protein for cytohesin exchange factors 1 isoform X1 n=2 Tax=Pleurodeles waltl TaxID=8319 RepID=UPI003709C218
MATDGSDAVSLRQKPTKKSRGSIFSMSRRRISCKDLGQADCQGWLYKKKEKGAFLGTKWKKFWSVLKESALYWYTNQMAEKAEGFINLPEFTVDRALECKKKHALKISHPQRKTFYFAAENQEEMNKWLNKLGIAVITRPSLGKNEDECWSESEHDEPEISSEGPPLSNLCQLEQQLTSSLTLSSQASCSSSSLDSLVLGSSNSLSRLVDQDKQHLVDTVSCSSATDMVWPSISSKVLSIQNSAKVTNSTLINSDCRAQNMVCSTVTASHNDYMDTLNTAEEPASVETKAQVQRIDPEYDEMQRLFKSLEQASLSPIGDRRPSTKRELRKSFIKRSKNPSINEKLHKIRTLNSTLKCKEHDLEMINQLLEDHKLTAKKYRDWKDTNIMLFQDIHEPQNPQDCCEESSMAPRNAKPHHKAKSDT